MRHALRLCLAGLLFGWVSSARADLVAEPAQVNFGIGYIDVTSAPQFVTVSNTANATVTVSLSPSGSFFVRAGGTCGAVPFTLAAQASCTLGYTFTPGFVGPTSATIRATPSVGTFADFRLTGQGEEGGLRTQPNQLMFPLQPVGVPEGPQDVTLSNTGPTTMTVVTLTPASGVFARTGGSCGPVPFTLAPQASCTLSYTSTPSSTGTFFQTLRATPDAGQFVDFGLAAEADIGRLTVSPSSLFFLQEVPVGSVSQQNDVRLENVRRVPMVVTAITPFNPPPVPSFVRTGGTCPEAPFTLGAFAQCTIGYTFAPIAPGKVELNINFSNSTGSPEPLSLRGTGVEANLFDDGFEDL